MLDDLGVAADDGDPRGPRRPGHRAHLGVEHLGGKPGLEHEGGDQRHRHGAAHREVVHGAVHRQLADRAAGKPSGVTTKLSVVIATDGVADGDTGGVRSRSPSAAGCGAEQERDEESVDQPPAGLAAGAVGHLDLRVAEPHGGLAGGPRRSGRRQPPLVGAAAFRCS